MLTDNKIYLTKEKLKTVDMTLQRMNTKQLLIQEYISGLECEVLVIQFKGKYYALEPVEIVINGNDFILLFFALFVWLNHFVICTRCWRKDVM